MSFKRFINRVALGCSFAAFTPSYKPRINAKLSVHFEDVEEELKKPEPKKDEVGQALDRAINYAQKANGFAEAIDKLHPHVEKSAAWLGQNWYNLLPLVGLAI